MADLSADPISNWRTMKHVMKMAACKARDAIASVSASGIEPFECRNEGPQVIAEARALTLRSIARAVWYQDLTLAQRLREDTTAGAQHIDISHQKTSLVDRSAFETEHSAMQLHIAEQRRRAAAARSRAAYAEQRPDLGERWRRRARRIGQRSEIWK
eukprot:8495760-Pyramimonas_sp.AAC.1